LFEFFYKLDYLVCDFNRGLLLMSYIFTTLLVFVTSCFILFVVLYTQYIYCWH